MKIFLILFSILFITAAILLKLWFTDFCAAGLSALTRQSVQLEKAEWQAPNRIYLKQISLKAKNGRALVAAESGQIEITGMLPCKFLVFLTQAKISPEAVARFKSVAALLSVPTDKAFEIPKLSFSVHKKVGKLIIQLFDCKSALIRVNGGVTIQKNKLSKLNALILFSGAKLTSKIPNSLKNRLVRRPEGWFGGKIVYAANHLRVLGGGGPLLEAQWAF